jgi:hypothetical protein
MDGLKQLLAALGTPAEIIIIYRPAHEELTTKVVKLREPADPKRFNIRSLRCPYCDKKAKNNRGNGVHQAHCEKNPNAKPRRNETIGPQNETADAKPEAAFPGDTIQEQRPSFFEAVKQKLFSFHIPEDFDPSKPFGVGAYVYLAAGRKIGKVITVDSSRDLVTVEFTDQTQQFTVDGARAMHKQMLVRAK